MITLLNNEQIKELNWEENLARQAVLRDELTEQIKNSGLMNVDDDGDGEGLEREIAEAILQEDGDEEQGIAKKEIEEQFAEYADLVDKMESKYSQDIINYFGENKAQQIFSDFNLILNEWWNLKNESEVLKAQTQQA